MSSCAASSCTCCPKASSASATLASSPTGGAPLSCRFACNSSAQYRHRRPNQKPPRSRNPAHFGSVPSVAAAWWSSRDLPRPSAPPWCASPLPAGVRPSCPQTKLPVPNLASNSRPNPTQTTTKPIRTALLFAPLPLAAAFLIYPTPLNLHKCFPTGGFLQTAVSDAPRRTFPSPPAHLLRGPSDTALAFLDSLRIANNPPGISALKEGTLCFTHVRPTTRRARCQRGRRSEELCGLMSWSPQTATDRSEH